MLYDPEGCRDNAFKEIVQAEANIAQCMANFICCIVDELKANPKYRAEEKIELFNRLILAATAKEKAITDVINALEAHFFPRKFPSGIVDYLSEGN